MGLYGKHRQLVNYLFPLAVALVLTSLDIAQAQSRRTDPQDIVRQRQAERKANHSPYWDGFVLKHQGNCAEAIAKLQPLANRGFGFEDAQTALGECYLTLAGLAPEGGTAPARSDMLATADYKQGVQWISKAAQAGHFGAQGVLVRLYAAGLGPSGDKIDAAEWAHLYLTNPQRLSLGAPVSVAFAIEQLEKTMSRTAWLQGKERARNWAPVFDEKRDPTNK
ncbi:MAG: hypothetical protein HOK33_05715 [Rhodobiaceae bacterium]|nr:hypothetical protein [Rhodobiaceae bacterium]